MTTFVTQADSLAARTRTGWVWIGQVALVVLGIHGAADRLDDVMGSLLVSTDIGSWLPQSAFPGMAWVSHETLMGVSIAFAITLELLVVAWAIYARLRANDPPIQDPRDWWSRRSIHAGIAAFAWLPLALAGCWVVAIAIEDQLADLLPNVAIYVGLVVAVLIAWRLGLTGWIRVVRHTPVPRRPLEGWPWIVPVGLVSILALRYGLPIWGWL